MLSYREEGGDGPLLVLLHGAARNLEDWQLVAPLLIPSYRVVTADLPGHGRSPSGEWSFEAAVDGVGELLDHLAGDRPVVAGHSLGGMVASACARRLPVSRVVNLDGFGAGMGRELPADQRRALADLAVAQLPGCAAALDAATFEALVEEVESRCHGSGIEPAPIVAGMRRGSRARAGLVRAVPDERTVREVLDAVDALDLASVLDAARVPVRLVRCTIDTPLPTGSPQWLIGARAAQDARIAALLASPPPHVEVLEVTATHGLLLEHPALTASLLG